jgi:serine phosphatase RsbU (regulator of sigma subunit)
MTEAQTRGARGRLRRFARRAGFISSAAGVLLSMIVAALLMRLALWESDRVHRSDLGALLVSSCQAALALGDRELLQDTLNELAPRLTDLSSAEARDGQGVQQAEWHRDSKLRADGSATDSFNVLDAAGRIIGSVALTVSGERARKAVDRMWLLLGSIALACLGVAWATSAVLGKEIDEKGRLEGELAAAERIQTSLLPSSARLPGFDLAARMVPADEVGGDYYDVIPDDQGGWICIGDAMGHGLPAGLTMLMLQSGISTLIRHQPCAQPREIIQAINRVIYENSRIRLEEGTYATLLATRYSKDGVVLFAGGHPDPILRRLAAPCSELLATEGPFVGLEPELEADAITQASVRLEPGDLLVFYTDGLTEARNQTGEMFGPERLLQAIDAAANLSLPELIDSVLAECRAFNVLGRDDMTLLAVRRQASERKTA